MNFPYNTKDRWSLYNENSILEQLSKLGITKQTELSRKERKDMFSSEKKIDITYLYDLTSEGKKYYKADATKNLKGENLGGFSFGKATVTKINNFTEPSDFMGVKVSRVTYTYTVNEIPDWAKTPELTKLIDALSRDVSSEKTPITRTDAFILTEKGWIHEKLFKK